MEPERALPRVKGVGTDDVATLYALPCPRLIGFLTVLAAILPVTKRRTRRFALDPPLPAYTGD